MNRNSIISDDAPLDAEAGRVSHYSKLGDWVVLSGASSHACKLYWILRMYADADNVARPTRRSLADLLGFKLTKNVDPYIAELETLGAITVTRGRRTTDHGNMPNEYVVLLERLTSGSCLHRSEPSAENRPTAEAAEVTA